MKRRVPETVRTSEVGTAFRPADLNDATLLATLMATEPRDLALKKAANGIDPGRAASLVEASQLENTDIFYVTYHSPLSPDDAVRFCEIWANEICEYTKRLQQSEARSVLAILNREVAELEKRIDDTNEELLQFAKSNDFIGGDSQVAVMLGKLSQIDLRLEDYYSGEKAQKTQLAELDEKIRHHSPLELSLREAREELATLRASYTEENPLVQKKLETIGYLQERIAELEDGREVELEEFTGTPLGNQLYLEIIAARNRLVETENHIRSLEAQRETASSQLAKFPALITRYEALRTKRDSYLSELSLMSNRLKEAKIFASSSPGAWQIFEPPDSRKVIASSLTQKPILLGAAGTMGGAGLAVMVTLLFTQRTTRRSVLECCAATRGALTEVLPSGSTDAPEFTDLWLSAIAASEQKAEPILLWTAALDPDEERDFWNGLAKAAFADSGRPLEVTDLTPDDLWQTPEPKDILTWHRKASSGRIFRATSLPDTGQRERLAKIPFVLALVKGDRDSLKDFSEACHHARAYLGPCTGTIVISEPPDGWIRRWADQLSLLLTRHLSRPSS
jgi:hypothetical protein